MKYQKANYLKKFLEERKDNSRMFSKTKVKKAHYASGGIGCLRKGVYEFVGTKELPNDVTGRMIFGLGDAGQEIIEKEFIGCKIFEAREQSIELQDSRLQYPFSMRIDGILQLPKELDAEQKLRPIEIKTSGSNQFYSQTYKAWGNLPEKTFPGSYDIPKEYHVQQLNLYLKAMDLDYGFLLVINRDDGNYIIYRIDYDDEMYNKVVEHCVALESATSEYKETGKLPSRQFESLPLAAYKRDTKENSIGDAKLSKGAFPCIWQNKESGRFGVCQFFDTCWADSLKELGLTMEHLKEKLE